MGFAAEEAAAVTDGVRWYGPAAVGQLSPEEGAVIASRVAPRFVTANGLRAERSAALSTLVATALYECFIGHIDTARTPGGLAPSCRCAVEVAARPLLGSDLAIALARAVESDLSGAAPR